MDLCLKCKEREFDKKNKVWVFKYFCLRKILEAHKKGHPVSACNFFGRKK